jgi:hypothetical protein
MFKWFRSVAFGSVKSWMTTVLGIAAGTPLVIDGITKHDHKTILTGILIAALGSFAKDANKSGAKSQAPPTQ